MSKETTKPTERTGNSGQRKHKKIKDTPKTVQAKILKKQEEHSFHLVAGIVSQKTSFISVVYDTATGSVQSAQSHLTL